MNIILLTNAVLINRKLMKLKKKEIYFENRLIQSPGQSKTFRSFINDTVKKSTFCTETKMKSLKILMTRIIANSLLDVEF